MQPTSPTCSHRSDSNRDHFKPSEQVKLIPAEDMYKDSELLILLRARAWNNGLCWHILPPGPALEKRHRSGYNIVSKTDQGYVKVSLYKLVSLFPYSRNLQDDYPEWIQSSISMVARTKAETHPMDFRNHFYHALKLRRQRWVRDSKKIPDDSGKASRESNASLVS